MCQMECWCGFFVECQLNCMQFNNCFWLKPPKKKNNIHGFNAMWWTDSMYHKFRHQFIFFNNIQVNYIPLGPTSSMYSACRNSSDICEGARRGWEWIYLKFRKQRDFKWSITVSVLHFKAVRNVIGVKNFNWITIMKFIECAIAFYGALQRAYQNTMQYPIDSILIAIWLQTHIDFVWVCVEQRRSPSTATPISSISKALAHNRELIQRIVSLCVRRCLCCAIERK